MSTSNNITLVTAYYDLTEFEERPEGKDKKNYLMWAEYLFMLNINIVFFVAKEIAPYITSKRKYYGLLEKTLVIIKEFNEMPFYNLRNDIEKYIKEHPIKNRTIKDTKNYIPLTWSKVFFVEEVLRLNPFNTDFFGWIDFGIYNVCVSEMD